MVFSSITFIIYFLPAFLLLYYLAPKKAKNIVLLLGSIFFYSWGAPKFIFVILATTFVDFYMVKWMNASFAKKKTALLIASISINLGLLIYFKYSNFFIENVNYLLSSFGRSTIVWTKLVLPIGISFYTFESITYSVDVYRGIHKPLTKYWNYQLYIILFPKLIAGPIVRYHDIAEQIENRFSEETINNVLQGFYRFSIGLGKKVLIANQMGLYADKIMGGGVSDLSTLEAWVGVLAYTFQIYFDFSGYSDMAIGLCKMVGFKIPENFSNPYTSTSITEFWRKWHISLGKWMKNYLYIPLGGSRSPKKWMTYRNLWLVFVFSGLWHGASWTFIVWGIYHGCFIIMEKGVWGRVAQNFGKTLSTVITFLLVTVGWVFFRMETIQDSFYYLHKMFSLNTISHIAIDSRFWFYFVLAIVFSFWGSFNSGLRIQNMIYSESPSLKMHVVLFTSSLFLVTISISSISSLGFNPFIYFRF
jgi:alginate O-acetyltransferase complex protein AlgI